MSIMKIYMDVCCLNRPFDNQSQDRIYIEAEAVLSILPHCQNGEWFLFTSDIIDYELSRLTNHVKLQKIRSICTVSIKKLRTTQKVKELSKSFQHDGVKLVDSLHLALCEIYSVDVLLTTDDQFIRSAVKLKLNTQIINPVEWLMEVSRNGK